MKKHRRTRSLAEKLEALQLLKKEGIGKTSRQLEVSSTTLYKWQALFEQQGEQGLVEKAASGKNPELERLQRENRELKMLVAEKELTIRVQSELLKKTH
jgi:transposase-like protein